MLTVPLDAGVDTGRKSRIGVNVLPDCPPSLNGRLWGPGAPQPRGVMAVTCFALELVDAAILRAAVDDATSQLQARRDRCLFCLAHLFAREGAHPCTP